MAIRPAPPPLDRATRARYRALRRVERHVFAWLKADAPGRAREAIEALDGVVGDGESRCHLDCLRAEIAAREGDPDAERRFLRSAYGRRGAPPSVRIVIADSLALAADRAADPRGAATWAGRGLRLRVGHPQGDGLPAAELALRRMRRPAATRLLRAVVRSWLRWADGTPWPPGPGAIRLDAPWESLLAACRAQAGAFRARAAGRPGLTPRRGKGRRSAAGESARRGGRPPSSRPAAGTGR